MTSRLAAFGIVTLIVVVSGRGPCAEGPGSRNLITGGVLSAATSCRASISQRGSNPAGIALVRPFALNVHVTFLLKSFGTVTVNMPQPRFGPKCVGCP